MNKKRFVLGYNNIKDKEDNVIYGLTSFDNQDFGLAKFIEKANNLNEENRQLKEQIFIHEKFLEGNDLDIEWDLFCTAKECIRGEYEEFDCKDCEYMRWIE